MKLKLSCIIIFSLVNYIGNTQGNNKVHACFFPTIDCSINFLLSNKVSESNAILAAGTIIYKMNHHEGLTI